MRGRSRARHNAILFPDVVRGAVLDGAFPLALDPWGGEYAAAHAEVLALRCERTGCDAKRESQQIRRLAAALAESPVSIAGAEQHMTEGMLASVAQLSLGTEAFSAFLEAVAAANRGEYAQLSELAGEVLAIPPLAPLGDSHALMAAIQCNDYSAPFDLRDDVETRRSELTARLAALPEDVGWFSKHGWLEASWEQAD